MHVVEKHIPIRLIDLRRRSSISFVDNGVRIDAIFTHFAKVFHVVQHSLLSGML